MGHHVVIEIGRVRVGEEGGVRKEKGAGVAGNTEEVG